jgi:GTPase Era involved in 16S rRNA processing
MDELAERLSNRQFTMVLFGAFSAGKSSFANALLGDSILPSSPNPTTAAINEVRKPDHQHLHGTVAIEMKTEKEIAEEINGILKSEKADLNSLIQSIEPSSLTGDAAKQIKHLQAFKEGYEQAKNVLNQIITTDLSEIQRYAAIEKNACFVKKITIYYDCPLTEKGIVLVDTPGANSIHSRHTDVAFEYMKHADVILYVTYFNHAFSHADREFLIQLGRIKDTFSSDKMFFAINASDLANSEEDKTAVVDHVKSNLQSFGIRHPRLYPVSSKNEISSDSELADSGFPPFRDSLNRYLENDLERAMIRSAESLRAHAKQIIQNIMSETRLRMEKEDDYLTAVQEREEAILSLCSEKIIIPVKQLNQEMKELLFYVKQRVLIRYHDFYKETIHPAAVNSSKSDLLQCLKELFEKIAHDLHQEFRASSLRLDKWIHSHLVEKEERFLNEAKNFQVSLQLPSEDKNLFFTPAIPSTISSQSLTDEKRWLSYFKNAKQFFENGGSNELKNELIKEVDAELTNWLISVEESLNNHYHSVVEKAESRSRSILNQQVVNYFGELKKPGDLDGKMSMLETCLQEIENV